MQGRCRYAQAEVFQAQEGSAEGFSGNRAGGEHGANATPASVPLSVELLLLMPQASPLVIMEVPSKLPLPWRSQVLRKKKNRK